MVLQGNNIISESARVVCMSSFSHLTTSIRQENGPTLSAENNTWQKLINTTNVNTHVKNGSNTWLINRTLIYMQLKYH